VRRQWRKDQEEARTTTAPAALRFSENILVLAHTEGSTRQLSREGSGLLRKVIWEDIPTTGTPSYL
jgi:hypothetical protein